MKKILQRKRNGCVVNILRSETEMNKFLQKSEVHFFEFFLQEILNSLYVVIGCFFNLLDLLSISFRKLLVYFSDFADLVSRKIRELGKNCGKGKQIFYFHLNPVAD